MIIPGILEKNLSEIKRKVYLIEDICELIQIDIVHGNLFKGESYNNVSDILNIKSKSKIQIHLMVPNPIDYLNNILSSSKNIDWIKNYFSFITQVEADTQSMDFINKCNDLGITKGISIGPDTKISDLEEFLSEVDLVQFMMIEPGKQGNKIISKVFEKIRLFQTEHSHIPTQADGGIKIDNISKVLQLGINNVVIGSGIFGEGDPRNNILEFKKILSMKKDQINTLVSKKEDVLKIKKIAILGGAAWKESDETYKQAYDVSKILAENGYEIVNGGGPGVMAAATEGAHAGHKRVLAVNYYPNKPKRHYEGVSPFNKFDEEVITLDYFDRTKVMLQNTDVHIVFRGSIGTLSEFGMTWISSWIHEPNSKPIILYGSFWNEILDVIEKNLVIKAGERELLKICTSPEEVLNYLKSLNN